MDRMGGLMLSFLTVLFIRAARRDKPESSAENPKPQTLSAKHKDVNKKLPHIIFAGKDFFWSQIEIVRL